ncbi:hypothetical protein BGX24_003937 [Mortierella sp. AD032]|nr:hypothetical protein BGX24_003937 [Mortierella sp. AD032]
MTLTSTKTHPVTGEPSERPKVLIVGAGIGGVTMGMLLTKAGIPFDIYERASPVKPLGSALFFNATTAKLFRQFGSSGYIVSRPMMYDLLLRQVPKARIHMSKKVTTVEQTNDGVVIHFDDKTTAKGDILVGADGAYSEVRQCIYDDLRNEGQLWLPTLNLYHSPTLVLLGPQAAEVMSAEVRDFPIISVGDKITTVGDLIDLTPKEYISKVMLEEKAFETWHHKRINPSGGSGANNAIHDTITLANWLNVLTNLPTTAEIENGFEKYKAERLPWVKQSFDSSLIFKVMVEANFKAKLVKLVSKYMPSWVSRKMLIRMTINQPEVSFLPPSEYLGSIAPAPQLSYDETLAILQERERKLQEGMAQSSAGPLVATAGAAPAATAV